MKMLAALLLLSFLAEVAICEDDQTMAVNFLNRYGYISPTRSGNHDVPTAIRKFQEFFGLPVSGKLDDSTIRLMKEPRCGMSDPVGNDRQRRFVTRGKWSKTHLTYFVETGEDLPHDQQKQIFADAWQFWADVSGLTFSEAGSAGEADIKISFGRKTHGGTSVENTCPNPFDGPGTVLAHAYFPEDGRAHFDEDETFTHGTYSGTNLLFVAVHEFGHNLGLAHSNIEAAIMYPYYTGYVPDLHLHSDDITGIQSLYGAAPESQCDQAGWEASLDRSGWSVCPQMNTYLKGLWRHDQKIGDERVGRIEFGRCCPALEKAFANQPAVCNNAFWWSTLDGNNVWALCPNGYFLNGLYKTDGQNLYNIEEGQCCRPQNQQEDGYEDCYDEDVSISFNNRGWSECQREGYYMTGIYKSNCEHIYCIEKFKCCGMKTSTVKKRDTTGSAGEDAK